jgi:hypothetical protein
MAFMGLTGSALAKARIFMIVMPTFLLFGFNQSSLNGVLSYPSFVRHFPTINTATTKGAIKSHNALVQGTHTKTKDFFYPSPFFQVKREWDD